MLVSFLLNVVVLGKQTMLTPHAGTVEPARVSPPEAAAYLLKLSFPRRGDVI